MNTDLHPWPLHRTKWRGPRLLCALAVVVLLSLLFFWRPLQRHCLTYLLLRSEAPSAEVLSAVVNETSDPKPLLERLWQTQRIPHRHFVLSYLGRTVKSAPIVFRTLEPVILDAAPALAALQQENFERLAVLGICVPPASSCADEHERKSQQLNHHHDGATFPSTNPAHVLDLIRGMALEYKITYPILLDSKGTVGLGFSVENLPAYVLIDASGMIRRRFVGDRNKQVLEAMIDEVSNANAEHTVKPFVL